MHQLQMVQGLDWQFCWHMQMRLASQVMGQCISMRSLLCFIVHVCVSCALSSSSLPLYLTSTVLLGCCCPACSQLPLVDTRQLPNGPSPNSAWLVARTQPACSHVSSAQRSASESRSKQRQNSAWPRLDQPGWWHAHSLHAIM
jgi:hypothetical protein